MDYSEETLRLADLAEALKQRLEAGDASDDDGDLLGEAGEHAQELLDLIPTIKDLASLAKVIHDPGLGANSTSTTLLSSLSETEPGTGSGRFGDFQLLRELGRGGMGIVFEAIQVSLNRRVALKVLSTSSLINPRAIRRFELEAEAAAMLTHPHIVPIYCVGMEGRLPYFAMQLIEGSSLADVIAACKYLEGRSSPTHDDDSTANLVAHEIAAALVAEEPRRSGSSGSNLSDSSQTRSKIGAAGSSGRERSYTKVVASIIAQAAEALQHAHEQRIIHRDLKPANLLLDQDRKLWVVDFGLARLDYAEGVTRSGDQPGTLRYMSPEQVIAKHAIVDRRTDIYSLGATLYELLTLEPAVPGTNQAEILHRIIDAEPIRPSKLNRSISKDLETIVLKAIAKEPAERYPTAADFADDLRRFVAGLPILARPNSPVTRAWSLCRRRPIEASLIACLALSLVLGLAGTFWAWRIAVNRANLLVAANDQIEEERDRALKAQQETARERDRALKAQAEASRERDHALEAEQISKEERDRALEAQLNAREKNEMTDALYYFIIKEVLYQPESSEFPKNRAPTIVELLDASERKVKGTAGDRPVIEARIRMSIGQIYHNFGQYTKSEVQLRRAYELTRATGKRDRALVEVESDLGHSLCHLGQFPEGIKILREAYELSEELFGSKDPDTLHALRYLADIYESSGEFTESERLSKLYLDLTADPSKPPSETRLTALDHFAQISLRKGRLAIAEKTIHEALAGYEKLYGPRSSQSRPVRNTLAALLIQLGRLDEAEREFDEISTELMAIWGPSDPRAITVLLNRCEVLRQLNRLYEAENVARKTLAAVSKTRGPDDGMTFRATLVLATILTDSEKLDEAEPLINAAVANQIRLRGPDHPDTQLARTSQLRILNKKKGPPVAR